MMHRLICARNIYHSNLHITVPSNNPLKNSYTREIKCSFCRKFLLDHQNIETLFLARHQSTRTASVQKLHKKKGKHKNHKKYGELLEVSDKNMTETQVSISKLHASHLSKLASSPFSLGEIYQLLKKPPSKQSPKTPEVDTELLQSVKNKLLNKHSASLKDTKEINLEDDKCALVFTSVKLSSLDNRLKTKEFIDMVKESYYNFRKATIYDQRLQDLRLAINEGINQQFSFDSPFSLDPKIDGTNSTLPQKGPHAVFREIFKDSQMAGYDQEFATHIANFQSANPVIEEIYDEDSELHPEIADMNDELNLDHTDLGPNINSSFNIKKARQELHKKKKERRVKRRVQLEQSMKQDMHEIERRGKHEALQRLLNAHLQLLCSIGMNQKGLQILLYYSHLASRGEDQPKVTDINIYNTLLHGYASKGHLKTVREILSIMTKEKIEPNPQTFAAVFECIERNQLKDKSKLLEEYHTQMKTKNISLNDLLDKSKFLYDQREVVLAAVRRLQPEFEPVYTPPSLDYCSPLLDQLKLDQLENRIGLSESPAKGVVTVEEMQERGRKQFEIEIKGEIEVQNIDLKDEQSKKVQLYRKLLHETECEWRRAAREAFVRNLGTLEAQSNASQNAVTLFPYLKVLETDQFVDLILSEIIKLVDGSETYSPTLKILQRDLGTHVYQKFRIEQNRRNGVLQKSEQIYRAYSEWYVSRRGVGVGVGGASGPAAPLNGRQAWQQLVHLHRDGASLDYEEMPWPTEIRQNVGKFLYDIIVNDVKININMFKPKAKERKMPGVYRVHRPWGHKLRLELKPHPVLMKLWAGAARPALRMRASLLPALAAPAPWTGHAARSGGYLATPTPLIRMPYNVQNQWKRLQEAPPGSLYPVLDSLNQLGEVPWRINKPILDLQLQVFRSGGDKRLDIPPPASSLDAAQFPAAVAAGASAGAAAAAAYKRRLALNRARAEMHSLWCDALYKLSLANHYRDEVFWLPHNLDFRGRVYACPPHLSQLGGDPARGLLRFARARPLGPRGLLWLRLHLVNLLGGMKRNSVAERLAYAESVTDKILESAARPLEGERWWARAEEPWQALACCMEIANALREPNPAEYMCGFPVHQDGSCNGLQHYAALGGDAAGAAAVNLAPGAAPQDVYSAVAALVEAARARDAAAGVPVAAQLAGCVRRKVIKQTVMTTVYGVTRYGARLQIAKQLKDIEGFPKEHVWTGSHYLTARTFESLGEMFSSTKLIQDWLTNCAKQISGVCGESVEWVTPLGLPVVQPYYRDGAGAGSGKPALDQRRRPCTVKQRNAFPPNFIHSLDSSHMMLTGLHCAARALTFVSVHDCYWTHPDTVDVMNQICREQFVALHSQPILNDLSDFLMKRFSYNERELADSSKSAANMRRVNSLLRQVPRRGDFDLHSVLRSVYFFS